MYWFERGGFLVSTGMPRPVLGESCTTSIKDFAIFPPHQKKRRNSKKTTQTKEKKELFRQDNEACHKSIAKMAKWDELHFELLPHPSYSPDLAPSDY